MVGSETDPLTRSLADLRQDVSFIVRAGIRAADAADLTRQALAGPAEAGRHATRYVCIAAGKAAAPMAKAAAGVLEGRLRSGLIVAPSADSFGRFESIAAGHPVPDEASERAGRRALQIAESLEPGEALLVLLSGGGSALMAVPAEGISLDDKRHTTEHMLRAGANIHALNTVRKHLSAIKGGWLASRAAGRVHTYVVSDVVGDDVSVIASGPTVPDESTFGDARQLLDRYGGASAYPARAVAHLDRGVRGEVPETPKPTYPRLVRSDVHVIGSRGTAMSGAAATATALGYHVVRMEEAVVGEARDAAASHIRAVSTAAQTHVRPLCVISSGETTVRVIGRGKGGRNQEFALAAAGPLADLPAPAVLGSVGTDGIDGPTDAAGAIVDSTTLARARARQIAPDPFLADNNAYAFFDALGDLIHTGPTGTNVGDLQILLIG